MIHVHQLWVQLISLEQFSAKVPNNCTCGQTLSCKVRKYTLLFDLEKLTSKLYSCTVQSNTKLCSSCSTWLKAPSEFTEAILSPPGDHQPQSLSFRYFFTLSICKVLMLLFIITLVLPFFCTWCQFIKVVIIQSSEFKIIKTLCN